MKVYRVLAIGGLLAAAPLRAQENPFDLPSGSLKSAHIVYDLMSKGKPVPGARAEAGVSGNRWAMRTVSPFEYEGKTDTMRILMVETRDSQYTWTATGSDRGGGMAGPTLRPHLAREYMALDAAGKARFRKNLKLLASSAAGAEGWKDVEQYTSTLGDKAGSETVAGQRCDVYRTAQAQTCVLPQAPRIFLRSADKEQQVDYVAKHVTLNGPLPPSLSAIPKGIRWEKGDIYDDADFVMAIWTQKKESDPTELSPATVTRFAIRYLASPQATSELPRMENGQLPPQQ